MKRISFAVLALLCAAPAFAFKVTVSWKNPAFYTNGWAMNDLNAIDLEWGTCDGTKFGVLKGSMRVLTTIEGANMSRELTGQADPTVKQICIRASASITSGAKSDYSNVIVKQLLPEPGKPVTLGQPIILSFQQE